MRIAILAAMAASFCFAQPTLPNAVPMPTPEIQYLDAAGKPLAGGKLCTYAAGTSTPLATYTDSTAGTPNTNPVVLNTAGRASVWVGPALYKFVLRTGGSAYPASDSCTTGTIQWTQDNVSDTTLYFANYVKTAGSCTLLTFTATGTGAVTRTCSSKLADTVSVKDFGATCDGVTDDFAAYGKSVSALGTQGGTVNLCKGISYLSATWVLDRSVVVAGQGNGGSCTASGSCLKFAAGVSGITTPLNQSSGSSIKDFYIQSSSAIPGTDDGLVLSSDGIVVNNVTVDGFGRRNVSCDASNAKVQNNIVKNGKGVGVYLNGVTGAEISGNWIYGNASDSIYGENDTVKVNVHHNILDTTALTTWGHAVAFHSTTAGKVVKDISINNNLIYNGYSFCVEVGSFGGLAAANISISNNLCTQSVAATAFGGYSIGSQTVQATIIGNTYINTVGAADLPGIEVVELSQGTVEGNVIVGDAIAVNATTTTVVSGNHVTNSYGNGIVVGDSGYNFPLSNNTIENNIVDVSASTATGKGAVYFQCNTQNIDCSGNQFKNNIVLQNGTAANTFGITLENDAILTSPSTNTVLAGNLVKNATYGYNADYTNAGITPALLDNECSSCTNMYAINLSPSILRDHITTLNHGVASTNQNGFIEPNTPATFDGFSFSADGATFILGTTYTNLLLSAGESGNPRKLDLQHGDGVGLHIPATGDITSDLVIHAPSFYGGFCVTSNSCMVDNGLGSAVWNPLYYNILIQAGNAWNPRALSLLGSSGTGIIIGSTGVPQITGGGGIILKSPDGRTCAQITIGNTTGILVSTVVACPL